MIISFIIKTLISLIVIFALSMPFASAQNDENETEGTIVVTASRTELLVEEATVPITVITKEDIALYGPGDLSLLLQQVSGVTISTSVLGAGIQVQGLSPEHLLILIDGQRVLGEKDGIIDISRLSLNNIERIEIVRGPSSVLYGSNAMGGVINIITSKANEPYSANGNLLYGNANQQYDASTGATRRWGSVWASINHRAQESFDLDSSNMDTDGPQTEQTNADIKSTLKLNRHEIITQAGYLRRDSQRLSSNEAGAVYDQVNRTEDFRTQITTVSSADSSKTTTNLQWSYFKDQFLRDQRNATANDLFQETVQNLTSGSLQRDMAIKKSFLTFGFEGYFESLSSDRLENGTTNRTRPSLFIQEQWTPRPKLTLMIGNRVDYDSWFGLFNSPKLGLNVEASPTLIIRGSSGLGYRAPSFKEMFLSFNNAGAGYIVSGNSALLPERLIGHNLGFSYVKSPVFQLNANVFRNDLTNLINAELTEGETALMEFMYQNTGSAFTQGVELDANIDFFYLLLQPKYTFTDAWEKSEPKKALIGRPRHTASLQTILQNKLETKLFVTTNWISSRPYFVDTDGDQELNLVSSKPYTLINARLQQNISRIGLNIALGANNLLNAGEPQFTVIQPRWFFVKVGGQFPTRETN